MPRHHFPSQVSTLHCSAEVAGHQSPVYTSAAAAISDLSPCLPGGSKKSYEIRCWAHDYEPAITKHVQQNSHSSQVFGSNTILAGIGIISAHPSMKFSCTVAHQESRLYGCSNCYLFSSEPCFHNHPANKRLAHCRSISSMHSPWKHKAKKSSSHLFLVFKPMNAMLTHYPCVHIADLAKEILG